MGVDPGPDELEAREDTREYPVFERGLQASGYPPFFILLTDKKRGNSDFADRRKLLKRFLKVFGQGKIQVLLGDREFIGKQWIRYLQRHQIPFCFRLKESGQKMFNKKGQPVLVKQLFHGLKAGESIHRGEQAVGLKGSQVRVCISALRSLQGELVVVMHSPDVEDPLGSYALRWQIECLFKALKSSGFHLEETHLTHPKRLSTLLSVLMIAFCYAYDWGKMQEAKKPQKLKKHGSPEHSLFRVGLDLLNRMLLHLKSHVRKLTKYFKNLMTQKLSL